MKPNKIPPILGFVLLLPFCLGHHLQAGVITDFNDGIPDWSFTANTNPQVSESNGHLTIEAPLPNTDGNLATSMSAVAWNLNEPLVNGRTREFRVTVVSTSRSNVLTGFQIQAVDENALYAFFVSGDLIIFAKVHFGTLFGINHFIHKPMPMKINNVILSMAQTLSDDTVTTTVSVLDRDANNSVIYSQTVVDTPGVDDSVFPIADLPQTGPDAGPPVLGGETLYLTMARISNEPEPNAEIVYDDLCVLYHDAIRLHSHLDSVTKEIVLSWQATELPLIIEKSPLPTGPWALHPQLPTRQGDHQEVRLPISETKQFFQLRNYQPLRIIQQPQDQDVDQGQSATLQVLAIGEGPLHYQWYHDAIPIDDATNATLIIANVTPSDTGHYSVDISDDVGTVTSEDAGFRILTRPTIVQHPQGQAITVGDTATFTVAVTNTATLPITYRWRKGNATVATETLNAHQATFTIPNAQAGDAGRYTVVVTNPAFTAPGFLSQGAVLEVNP